MPLLRPARYKGAWGGRGSAKSHFFAGLVLEDAITDGVDVVCIREIQRTLDQSVKKLLEIKIREHNIGDYFEVQDRRILTRPTGGGQGVISFEGMQNHTADSVKSLEGFGRAWVEEAQSLSQRSLDLLRPTIRSSGSQLWFSWNPDEPTDPVDMLLRGGEPPPDSVVVEASYRDNPWFPVELRDEMEYDKRRDPDKYGHVWLGGYRALSEARVFKNWRVEEFERPHGTIHRLGADWGYSVDPSVLIRCDIERNRLYIDYEAYMVGCEIVQLPDLFDAVPEARKWFITADSSRPETISFMKGRGFRINAAVKGARSVEEGVAFLQSFDIIVHPRCEHTIDELTRYSYKTDPKSGKVLPLLQDKNNHVIDALRYACEGARREAEAQAEGAPPPVSGYRMAVPGVM